MRPLLCSPEHWLARSPQWRVQPWKRWAPQKENRELSFVVALSSWERRPSFKGALCIDGKRTEECHMQDAQSSEWTAGVFREVSPRQESSWHQEKGNFFTLCGWGSRLLKPGADHGSGDTYGLSTPVHSMYVRSSWIFSFCESGTTRRAMHMADMLLGWLEDKQLHTPQSSQLSGYWWSEKLIQDDQSMSKWGLFGVLFQKNFRGHAPGPQALSVEPPLIPLGVRAWCIHLFFSQCQYLFIYLFFLRNFSLEKLGLRVYTAWPRREFDLFSSLSFTFAVWTQVVLRPKHFATVGSNLSLSCDTIGSPVAYNRTWFRRQDQDNSTAHLAYKVLAVNNLQLQDSGLYHCFADNGLSSDIGSTEVIVSCKSGQSSFAIYWIYMLNKREERELRAREQLVKIWRTQKLLFRNRKCDCDRQIIIMPSKKLAIFPISFATTSLLTLRNSSFSLVTMKELFWFLPSTLTWLETTFICYVSKDSEVPSVECMQWCFSGRIILFCTLMIEKFGILTDAFENVCVSKQCKVLARNFERSVQREAAGVWRLCPRGIFLLFEVTQPHFFVIL